MFEQLTERFGAVFKKLRSRGKLHPKQIDTALDDIRTALLEADVAVEVIEAFLGRVRDATVGQDAVRQARAFMDEVDLTGFVITKLDGDARGGAALSVTEVTGRPVYFAGVGEKPADLEPFHPDRMASRILGMGDVLTLVEKAEKAMDEDKAREAAERMAKDRFTLEDFLSQLREV